MIQLLPVDAKPIGYKFLVDAYQLKSVTLLQDSLVEIQKEIVDELYYR